MVASDTVIGVVGAVLLAAVMVGVFVYEYNNAPEVASTDDQAISAFRSDYPGLNATADLDADDEPNFRDADLDGDGIDNRNDTAVDRRFAISGGWIAVGPNDNYSDSDVVEVQEGLAAFTATVTYEMAAPAPLGFSPLTMTLVDADGEPVGDPATESTSGTTVTLTLEQGALEPGTYTLRYSATGPGSPTVTSYAGEAVLDYGLGYAAPTHQH